MIKKETGDKREFGTGAKRQAAAGKGLPSLFPGDAYIDICKHFEDGAIHYDARNWEKGLPLASIIDSLERHIAAEKMGDTSESHSRALAWNAVVYLATKLRIKAGILPAELDDMPKYEKKFESVQVYHQTNWRARGYCPECAQKLSVAKVGDSVPLCDACIMIIPWR